MKVEFEGLEEIEARLEAIRMRVENPRPLLESYLHDMSGSIDQTFNLEGFPNRWPARTSGGGWPVLDKTGHLRDAAASESPGNGSIVRLDVQSQESSLEKGVDVFYGKYHQQPKELDHLKTGKMPLRRFLVFFQTELIAWRERARRFFWRGEL